MIKIPCHCGNTIESSLDTEINLAADPEVYTKIVEGEFMTFTCPNCGNELKTETALHLFDERNKLDIQFIPELDRGNYLGGHIAVKAKRVAIGYRELVEKIVIAGAGLDDRVIEIIKFRLLEKADADNISISLNGTDDESLVFHIYGLKPDQVGISHIPKTVYSKIESELDELLENEDIKLFTDGPYVSVSRVYLED